MAGGSAPAAGVAPRGHRQRPAALPSAPPLPLAAPRCHWRALGRSAPPLPLAVPPLRRALGDATL
eukprot:6874748-Lingulodinium_polyedra.AAC.1